MALANRGLGAVVAELAAVIVANKAWLSELDGRIGDGDHGANMAKGFARAADRVAGQDLTLGAALAVLSDVLMGEIGGSMGPLYGVMFDDMAQAVEGRDVIDITAVDAMLKAALAGVQAMGNARVGDKTMIDTLSPAVAAFGTYSDKGLTEALARMVAAAETGRDSTIGLVARLGRASRLGERSRGMLDAGAVSCCLILTALAGSLTKRLD
jgi:dihydroxyacetone kinase phosphoprotein-dependent L subunit